MLLPNAPVTSATAVYLVDLADQLTLDSRNADLELPMASTTKIMTAYVALTFGTLDQRITVGADAAAMINGINSVAGLRQGEVLTLRQLLYGLLLPSGDDAAVTIADGVAGSQSRFVALMNQEAVALGLTRTHYANVHGLDDPSGNHYTTARDLARLALQAMAIPTFRQIVGTVRFTIPVSADRGITLTNTNELLTAPGVLGIKTGFTGKARYCLVFMATRASGTLLGVLLSEPSAGTRFGDAAALLDWGFGLEQDLTRLGQIAP